MDYTCVYVFKVNDTYYRAIAKISKEDAEKYIAIDFSDEDYQEQQNSIVAPLEIDTMENLSEQIIDQKDLDKLVGKTGKELVEEGWKYNGSYDLGNMNVEMENGPFQYTVTFDGEVDEKDYEDYDVEKGTANMKVTEVKFNTVGDATSVE